MSTRKSNAQRAEKQVSQTPALQSDPILTGKQENSLNYILFSLREHNEDLSDLRSSLLSYASWFKEYTKSKVWVELEDYEKDDAHEHFETLRHLLEVMEQQSDVLFPEGRKSANIEFIDQKFQIK